MKNSNENSKKETIEKKLRNCYVVMVLSILIMVGTLLLKSNVELSRYWEIATNILVVCSVFVSVLTAIMSISYGTALKKEKQFQKLENPEFITIPELGIKVSKKVSEKMTYVEAEKYCKDNNAKMLNVLEAGYIFDNGLIENFCKEREWLEHYSQKTRNLGFECSALGRGWDSDDRLDVDGDDWDDDRNHAFGVRLVYKTE